jgi:CBS domain-containing protein
VADRGMDVALSTLGLGRARLQAVERRDQMRVRDIMSKDVACCSPETSLPEVAAMMVDNDCGEIPVVNASRVPVGVITDRDITCRTVAQRKNPLVMEAGDCMTSPCVTVTPETSLEDCCQVLEDNKVRRVPVVDESGACCGMVSQADIARHASKGETGKVVKKVSQPDRGTRSILPPLPVL